MKKITKQTENASIALPPDRSCFSFLLKPPFILEWYLAFFLERFSKKKRAKQIPEDFDPPREISEAHGLDHEKAVTAFKDWAIGGGKVYADWIATYRNACRSWLPSKFEGARKQLHQGVKVI